MATAAWCAAVGALVTATAAAQAPPLDLLSPREPTTAREQVHVLGRTSPGSTVRVGGEPVTVFATGVFARDRIPLAPGANRIAIDATAADGTVTTRLLEVERVAPPAPVAWPADRLALDGASLQPAETVLVAPGEPVEVRVRATPGQRAEARLPGQRWQALSETAPGRYRGLLVFAGGDDVEAAPVQVRLSALALPRSAGLRQLLAATAGSAGQWRTDPERLVAVGAEGAELLHGLHEVRLGGPFLGELPAGTLLPATGRRGEFLRVQLAPGTTAWVPAAAVAPAPAGTAAPHAAVTTLSVAGGDEGDVVSVPLAARVPYAVRAVEGPDGRQWLELDLYGAHHATTWISHRASARLVRLLTAEQAGPDHVRIGVFPHAARLWGWRVERTPTALRVVLRAAPAVTADAPLRGLHVALEPGHGSADNLGAVGATGVPEKDINRWTADALRAELEAAGARVTVVRDGDENPPLRERARRVAASQAQLFVSVHANASDTGAGFLRTAGTATFYKHLPSHALAAAVQQQLLRQTGLDDFGLVGNFNYAPLRLTTWMPAVLVEQAFVSHPGDEAKLLDPAFRALLARAVRMGLEDFLRRP